MLTGTIVFKKLLKESLQTDKKQLSMMKSYCVELRTVKMYKKVIVWTH